MKNKLTDLNNYLFETIERLMDDDLSDEKLQAEIGRAKAVQGVAATIIANGQLALNVKKHYDEYGEGEGLVVPLLERK